LLDASGHAGRFHRRVEIFERQIDMLEETYASYIASVRTSQAIKQAHLQVGGSEK